MSKLIWNAVIGSLVLVLPAHMRAQPPEELKPLIEKVLNAYGGEKKLSQVKAVSFTRKTTAAKDNKKTVQKVTIQLPAQLRSETEYEENGEKVKQIFIHSGTKAWVVKGDKVEEKPFSDEQFVGFGRALKYQMGLVALLLADSDRTLEAAGEIKIGDKTAVGIKVTDAMMKKAPPRTFYFDKATGLLLKRVMSLRDKDGQEFEFEMTYHDYKKVDGIMVAHKTVSKKGGEVILEQQISDFHVLEKVDPKLFQKPEMDR